MYKILISDKLGQAGLDRLDEMDDMSYDMITGLSKEELMAKLPDYDALIVRSGTRPDSDILAAGKKLKVVGRAGIGVDNIDLEAATKLGIFVMNTPQANSVATAEQTMALMLAVNRHTAPAHASLLAGEWARSKFVGTELYGKTLGIIGFGYIGRLVAARAQAFGMTVIAYDPYISEAVGREHNVELFDLDDLLAQTDILTLHTVVSPETTRMINRETIGKMKDGVILINVARGKLIDEEALAAGLQSGKVAAAGLDVYFNEPPTNSPLIGLPNVLHTPHLGASSREAQRAVAVEMVEAVADALRGVDFRNTVNVSFPKGLDFNKVRPYMALAEKIGRLQSGLTDAPFTKIEIEVGGEEMKQMVRPIASALLKGLLIKISPEINEINAPLIAEQHGVQIAQEYGQNTLSYTNLVWCRAHWKNKQGEKRTRVVAGALFAGLEPRIVEVDDYLIEAKPEGLVLIMRNQDVPGVIGQVATILATYGVNIGEWRLGRSAPGGEALSFINLDGSPPAGALDALSHAKAVTAVKLIEM
ncbi:MAG: phosphoglycerate dehydrogenase [Ardenticatenaceae bacterium]|nr:phosphoglycerate dehydrogenase [Ardenticatenaceae bacterium]